MVADYLKIKLRQGLDRIHREHPEINFGVSSPGLTTAERALDAECLRWACGESTLADVQRSFKVYERELKAANALAEVSLFG